MSEKQEGKAEVGEEKKAMIFSTRVERKQNLLVRAESIIKSLFSTNTPNLLLISIFLESLQVSWSNYMQDFSSKCGVIHADCDMIGVEIEFSSSWMCKLLPS